MKGLSHQQAIKLIDRRLDGLIDERQLLLLDEHLAACDSCRLYAAEMNLLPTRLQNDFHARWDEKPGPSQKVTEYIAIKAKRIPMTNRISSGLKLFAGLAALLAAVFLINLVVSQLRSTSIVATTGTQTANPLPQPEDRLLAFASDQNGNFEIYTMHPDGSDLTDLTNNPAKDTSPFWSPDGRRISFISDRDGSMQIYLMDADGSNVIQLTHGQGNTYEIDLRGFFHPWSPEGFTPWSPDGKKLIFSSVLGKDNQLYVMDIAEKKITALTKEPGVYVSPSWSPDGKHIAFASYQLGTVMSASIFVVDENGKDLTEITKSLLGSETISAWNYRWSEDGNQVLFIANDKKRQGENYKSTVYEAGLDGSLTVHASTDGLIVDWWEGTTVQLEPVKGSSLTWLKSDGSQSTLALCPSDETLTVANRRSSAGNLAVVSNCLGSGWMLYWANPDGTLTNKLLSSPIPGNYDSITNMTWLTWSPDDQFIAFAALDTTSANPTDTLYVLNVAQARDNPSVEPLKMANSSGPSWQPVVNNAVVEKESTPVPQANNRLIAFTSAENGNSDIFVMNTDGAEIQNITNNLATDRNPVWSPDGQKIAFESDRNGKFDVYVMNADGSDVTQVTSNPAFDILATSYDSPWSPDGKQIIVQSNQSGQEALYVVPVDGTNEAIKISDTPGFVTWSPTGNQIAYSYISEKSGLNNSSEHDAVRIVNADGTNDQSIIQTGLIRAVHWSTDGKMLYYINGWGMERVRAHKGTPESILNIEEPNILASAWLSPDSTIVYQSTDPQGVSSSLYRWKAGKSSLVGQLVNQSETCEITASYAQGTVVSHDTNQMISYTDCSSGQVIFTVHDLINNTSNVFATFSLANPEIGVDWSNDDQLIAIRTVQSDSGSSGLAASLYVLRRDELSHPPVALKPVIEQANGLTQVAIQPVFNREIVNLPTAEPKQIPPTGELIAFVSTENGNSDIYTVHSDGSSVSDLTNNPAEDTSPVWSPDGSQIAFVSNRDGNENIYVMNFDGSNVTRLTDDPAQDTNPVWSPDGTKIAYASGDFTKNNTNIYVMDSNGQNQRQLTSYVPNTTVWPQIWSPDSQFILFEVYRQIVQVGIDDGLVAPITPQIDVYVPAGFVLSTDDSTLNYLTTDCNGNERGSNEFCNVVKTINRDGSNEETRTILKIPKVCGVDANLTWTGSSNQWSPDQNKLLIAFTCEDERNGWLYIAKADGSDFKRLTNYPVFDNLPDKKVATFAWSPDSKSILFASSRDHAGHDALYLLNIHDVLANPDFRPTRLNVSLAGISSIAWQPLP